MAASDTDPPMMELFNTVEGATWVGISEIGPITFKAPGEEFATVPPVPMASAVITLTLEGRTRPSLTLTTEVGGGITIHSYEGWFMSVPPRSGDAFALNPGTYYGKIKVTDELGDSIVTHRLKLVVKEDDRP